MRRLLISLIFVLSLCQNVFAEREDPPGSVACIWVSITGPAVENWAFPKQTVTFDASDSVPADGCTWGGEWTRFELDVEGIGGEVEWDASQMPYVDGIIVYNLAGIHACGSYQVFGRVMDNCDNFGEKIRTEYFYIQSLEHYFHDNGGSQ